MFRRVLWLAAASMLAAGAFFQPVQARSPAPAASPSPAPEESASEAGLDLTLRSRAMMMPVVTADGSALTTLASHAYLMDYTTGTVLMSKAATEKMYPSSMTKMMTLYMLFDQLKQGTLTLNSQFTVSEKAWRIQGSKMFVPIGQQVGLEDLLRGIAIQSGNDACIVVAEGIAGSEEAFAKRMNETAQKIGMTGSNFTDASGWPSPEHVTTAHDLAVLGAAMIRDFPQYYPYVAEREFTYHNIRQYNRNLLLANAALGVDGIKTGHTDAAGYGITLSAKKPGTNRRLVLVVNGLSSEAERASEGERLLNWGFQNFDNLTLFKQGQEVLKGTVWMGKEREVALGVASDFVVTLPKLGRDQVKISATYNGPISAPVTLGTEVGKLTIILPNGTTQEAPLVTVAAVEKLGFFARALRKLGL